LEDFFSDKWCNDFSCAAFEMGVNINSKIIQSFASYGKELIKWNKIHNLTSITDPSEIAVKHFLDSLSIASLIKKNQATTILDVGSGPGFPGIPLAIVFPSISVLLLDSSRKKNSFQKYLKSRLNLNNIKPVNKRIEDFRNIDEYQKSFQFVISRAFLNINKLIPLVEPLILDVGKIIAMKAEKTESELDNFLYAKHYNVLKKQYILPFINQKRFLLIFTKK